MNQLPRLTRGTRLLLLLMLQIVALPISAQIEVFPLKVLTTEQGLSHGTVWSVAMDRKGFLWVATSGGLNRYDGYEFKVFRRTLSVNSLPDNFIRYVLPEKDNRMWVGTASGLALFDTASGQAKHYRQPKSSPHQTHRDFINCLVRLPDGSIMVGTDRGLSLFDHLSETFHPPKTSPSIARIITEERIRCMLRNKDGTLWVGTDRGLIHYDPRSGDGRHYHTRGEMGQRLSHNQVRSLHLTPNDGLWIGTSNGLNQLENGGRIRWFFADDPETRFINDNWVNVITGDEAGRLWVGTRSGGVSLINPKTGEVEFFSTALNQGGLPSNNIVSLMLSKKGLLWIGTYKAGLVKLDLKTQKFRGFRVHQTPDQTKESIAAIYLQEPNQLWLGNLDGLIVHNRDTDEIRHYHHDPKNPNSLSDNSVLSISGGRNNEIWVGTYGGGLNRYLPNQDRFQRVKVPADNNGATGAGTVNCLYFDQATGKLWVGSRAGLQAFDMDTNRLTEWPFPDSVAYPQENRISVISPGPEGVLWVGTNGGFCKYVPERGEFRRFRHDPNDPSSLKHDSISAILQDEEGIVWVGTNNGLSRFDPWSQTFTTITVGGLDNRWINGILQGRPGELWITTNAGLLMFTPPRGVRVYDQLDGLQGKEFLPGAHFRGTRGELLIGGVMGYNSFFPREMLINPHIPNVAITSFRIFDREIPMNRLMDEEQRLLIPHGDNFFSFNFSALDFTAPLKNRYAFKLEGFDDRWNQNSGRRYASYTNLPSGDYRFRVKASNNDGVWNEEGVVIPVRIVPPWWARDSVLGVLVVLAVILAVVAYRYRMRDLKHQQKRLAGEADRHTDALRGAHQKLAEEVRKAGIAEMTTGVLHNIGNILTTVSTSTSELRSVLSRSKMEQFAMVNKMLADQRGRIPDFLQEDPKGKLIPEFLTKVARQFERESQKITHETDKLLDKVALMAQAVSMEQSYVSSFDRKEQVDLTELMDNALSMLESSLKKRNIQIIRSYETTPPCNLETVKLVHVVTNIINNAADALSQKGPSAEGRWIKLRVRPLNGEFNEIQIVDNGCGISKSNLARMFEFGFTTKTNGHGFGLHSCRATMKEMGGDISIHSEGVDQGTTIALTVPITSRLG
ncbi:sensor histidine kinase [Acanthopleuribacter pedis]|uniref:histidine kinase n=1 Tax=Acanthopleuribacter pedis TaxID=442870 RepID=A0A8J7QE29_9BACT|nr:sensor histidine kinase [Acanthopleuribacter pedis]MBO1322144.1 GHKL domain-containing protein [Acanthopleuribacter pedis]